MKNSGIEWTHHTFNIAWGCVHASPGCDNCYAETLAKRWGYGWGPGAERRIMADKYWTQPRHWNTAAARDGVRYRVFCSSMTDVFLNDRTIDEQRERLWPLIKATPNLDWQILTKHPERFRAQLPSDWGAGYPNVWLGVSVEDNDAAWRSDALRATPAVVRFLSMEPLIGAVDRVDLAGIRWVIAGGESGPHARPMDLDWVRDIRDRCAELGAAFFLKQLGGRGDKRGGEAAVLDGRRWTDFPEAVAA